MPYFESCYGSILADLHQMLQFEPSTFTQKFLPGDRESRMMSGLITTEENEILIRVLWSKCCPVLMTIANSERAAIPSSTLGEVALRRHRAL